ncbi:MAG: GntR family transcriptional regulator [Prevotella sp.]|nr:GntR family transcriptional regulator [Prevotella sp.]
MEFRKQKPIYLQIADSLCERIIAGEWQADGRIASVRDVAAELGVTPNTVMRSFDYLQGHEIIYNRRGTGYYVSTNAIQKILDIQRREFLEEEAPSMLAKMKMLGITLDDLSQLDR